MNPLYKFVNWYTQCLPFPKKGWKYVQPILQKLNLSQKVYQKKLFNGLRMHVNATDHIQKTVFWYGYYGKEVSHVWQHFIKPESVALDVGANIGYFTLLAAAKAKKGKVCSFEPVSAFRERLHENISLNNFRNVVVLPFAVSDRQESTTIFLANPDNVGMTSMQPPENFSGKTESVASISLDEWLLTNPLPKIDLIKIDVEGAELKVLKGMQNILQNQKPVIFIEIISLQLSKFENSAREVYTTLRSHGYEPFEIITSNTLRPIHNFQEGYDIVFLPINYKLPASLKIINQKR